MIEVGKVVTRADLDYRSRTALSMMAGYHDDSPRTYTDKDWATVWVGPEGVAVSINTDTGSQRLMMTPEQAIEIAQMLMKSAESQVEYAQAREELQAELNKLDATFKDRISGLGIDGVEESKVVQQNGHVVRENVIIVDAG